VLDAARRQMLTLEERAEIAKAVRPNLPSADVLNLAACIRDVEMGIRCQALTPAEQDAAEAEIRRREAAHSCIS
jgi:hypothetical protein